MANEKTEIKQSVRVQTSVLNALEKKVLVWIASRLPLWVTSDMLTWFGVFGSFLGFIGYVLCGVEGCLYWMWLSSLGLVINWFGDSLDGSVARVRQCQRPLYGYYLDHNIDCVCEFFLFVGIGLSGMMNLWIALIAYIFYLQLEVYVAINAKIKNEFKLTYGGFGPTELRLLIILLNTLMMYVPAFSEKYWILFEGKSYMMVFQLMDWIGLAICAILLCAYLVSFFSDLNYFAKLDPLHKPTEKPATK